MPRTRAIISCCIIALLGGALATAQEPCRLDFERVGRDWVASPIDENTGKLSVLDHEEGPHAHALRVPGRLPKSMGVTYYPWRDWTGYTTLSFELFVPPEMPESGDLQVYIKDRHYWWYQTFPLHEDGSAASASERKPMPVGEWTRFELDISEDSPIWEPGGHEKAWHRVLHRPRELGIRIFCDKPFDGWVLLDNVRLSGREPPLGRFDPDEEPKLQWGLGVELSATQVPVYEKLEVTFDPGRVYENPYDPEVVDVQGRFLSPGGEEIVVPGFYYRDYRRSRTEEGWEELVPVGEPCWKVRFSPTQQGRWRFYVAVRDELGELRSDEKSFLATEPHDPRGLVRVSDEDPMYFEFDNGDLFVPWGMNMRDGGDHAERQKGTYAFDYFFRRFEEEGVNFVRTWMCAWWAGIEWDEQYHSRYDGVGRYSMYNAWRLDYLFDLAKQHDIFIELTFNSHGQLRRDKYDAEWRYNPWAARNGGYIPSPSMFFTNEQAKEDFRKRYRYIVARWGYSQHLMSYDLWNEIDLSEGSDAGQIAAWHAEMADYLRSIDPWNHLICTHVCLYDQFGDALWQLPQIEYIQADAYWQDRDTNWHGRVNSWFLPRAHYRSKPMLFIEYGPKYPDVAAYEERHGPYPEEIWRRDWRVVGWIGNMMPMACPPIWWYHQEWDDLELYELQQAMMRFNGDLDPRGLGLRNIPVSIDEGTAAEPEDAEAEAQTRTRQGRGERQKRLHVFGQAKAGIGIAMFYVYHWENMSYKTPQEVPAEKHVREASVELTGLDDGAWRLQWWDPYAGEITGEKEIEVTDGRASIELPEFAQDLAGKLIAVEQ
ncbi:MAG: DUF5060 domain-containing protein [Armatimonadota bacterium]